MSSESKGTKVLIFKHPEFPAEIRTVTIDGEPYFVGVDIARALGYAAYRDAVANHVDDDDRLCRPVIDAGQSRMMTLVNESGLYSLIFGSRLEKAKEFKHWVTSEVLPEIRKTGHYNYTCSYQIDDPIERARAWIKEQEEKRLLESQNQVLVAENEEMKPKARIYDNLIDSRLLVNFRDAAKEIGISQTQFTGWLKENGFVYANSKGELRPREPYMESGFFQMKPYTNPYNGFASSRTFLTPTGLSTFKLMIEDSGHTRWTMKKHGGRNGRQRHQYDGGNV